MAHDHCDECERKNDRIRELEDKLHEEERRVQDAIDHLQDIENRANSLYRDIRTNF